MSKRLYGIIHDTKNPLNWFERMRQRQTEKPQGLNANIGAVHRSIEDREQRMVGKSGSGDQRGVAKLAGMDSVEYYKKNSGVLNLARSDKVLISKIREASAVDASPSITEEAPPPPALVGEVAEVAEGGGVDANPPSKTSSGVGPSAYGSNGNTPMGDTPEAEGGGAVVDVLGSVKSKLVKTKIDEIPAPTGGDYEKDVSAGMDGEKLTAKYGPVPQSRLEFIVAVAVGDVEANGFARGKAKDFIEKELELKIGSREFFDAVYYANTGKTLEDAMYEKVKAKFLKEHPSYKESSVPKSKKEVDDLLTKMSKKEAKELKESILATSEALVIEKSLEPFRSNDKGVVRYGLNKMMSDITEAVKIASEKDTTGRVGKASMAWPSSVEIRKTSNNEKIGRLFINGVDISNYVLQEAGSPLLMETIGKVSGVFAAIKDYMEDDKRVKEIIAREMVAKGVADPMDAMKEAYPLISSVFDSLEKQIEESLKPHRPRGKGGRPVGSKNKKSSLVASALGGGSGGGPEGSTEL